MASAAFKTFYEQITSRAINPNQSIGDIRSSFEKLLSDFDPKPDVRVENFSIGNIPAMKCSASKLAGRGIILFFHAGAYNAGSSFSHRDLMGRISEASGLPVVGIDYRLAPENPYPAAFEDALAAYLYLLQISYQPSEVILAGCSAGGGLILSLMLHLKKERLPLPQGAVCICPWVDLTCTGKSIRVNEGKDILSRTRLKSSADIYLGKQDPKDPFVSPLYGDLAGLPPLFIQIGNRELLLDETIALADHAQNQGIIVDFEIWPDMFHTWQLFAAKIPEGQEAINKIGAWINKVIQ